MLMQSQSSAWDRTPSHQATVVVAAIAALIGGWLYFTYGNARSSALLGDSTFDAVQVVLRWGKPLPTLTPAAEHALTHYRWPARLPE
jgi:hypothetical protein